MVTVINAEGLVVGRMATQVAKKLLAGEEVHIVNAEKALYTGSRDSIMERFHFKRDVGTRRKGPFYPRMPHMIVKRTVRGMLNYQTKPSHREAYRRLRVHIGVPDELEGQAPAELASRATTRTNRVLTVGQISKLLGAKF